MSMDAGPSGFREKLQLRRRWPWLVLAMLMIPAAWHVLDFDEDIDPEFPLVERPVFSAVPPAAYRLAEPGDTLDRVELYLAAASMMLAAGGLVLDRKRGLWPAWMAIAAAGLWYSATPGPTVDGWYGLGWRTIADSRAPVSVRLTLLAAALALSGVVVATAWRRRDRLGKIWGAFRERGTGSLWIAALVLGVARQFEIPGVEPQGYWPRWAMIGSFMAFDLGLLIELAPLLNSPKRRWTTGAFATVGWLALVVLGIAVTWYHRPLARLKEIVPDRIYISAMPTCRGLEIAQGRHHFRTIINLFPEETAQRSPLLGEELAFVKENGIRYLTSPADPSAAASNAFLNETLALAQVSVGLADPRPLPRLHGSFTRLDGDLPIPGAGASAGVDHAGDRATPGLSPQGLGDPAVQPRTAATSGGPILVRSDGHVTQALRRGHIRLDVGGQ